nr:proton-conducting transporter membrane subunit [Motiliproteus sp. SC1-56]
MLLFAWSIPLLLAPLVLLPRSGRWLLVLAPLPALLAGLTLPLDSVLSLPWLLLGTEMKLDAARQLFLIAAAALWSIASLHTVMNDHEHPHSARLRLFMALAMAGNIGLIVSADMISFYLGFSTMGLASYGLVVHSGSSSARRAGRVYLVMTLMAEFILLVALLLLHQRTGTLAPSPEQLRGGSALEIGLLFAAFATKAGLLGFHVWLPLAHPAAPEGASAMLSGAMIKTALLGWITFLPMGTEALPLWGWLFIGVGAAGALVATVIGLTQTDPKVVLAYSSISKMSLLSAVLGVALIEPGSAPELIMVVAAYAVFHGFNKGALFIGVGITKRYAEHWLLLLLALPAAVISGAPYGAGAAAKTALTELLFTDSRAADTLLLLLTLMAFTTPWLMLRFLHCANTHRGTGAIDAGIAPWLVLLPVATLVPLLFFDELSAGSAGWWLAGVVSALLLITYPLPPLTRLVGRVPPGDLIELLPSVRHRAVFTRWQRFPDVGTRGLNRLRALQFGWPLLSGDRSVTAVLPLAVLLLLATLLLDIP